MKINLSQEILVDQSVVYLIHETTDINQLKFSKSEIEYISKKIKEGEKSIELNHFYKWSFFVVFESGKKDYQIKEKLRKEGAKLNKIINKQKIKNVIVNNITNSTFAALSFSEGLSLSNYQFLKYFKEKEEKENSLKEINIVCPHCDKNEVKEMEVLTESVYKTRNLVNEPLSYLTAVQLSEEIKEIAADSGGFQ